MEEENNFEMEDVRNEPEQKKGSYFKISVILVVLIGLIILGFLFAYSSIQNPFSKSGEYQAVFLNNNQVYFGKLSNKNSKYVTLKDVYYLRVTQTIQEKDGKQISVPDINLIKLGTEIHKPTDRMEIQRGNILFIEDLSSDSKVIEAIKSYQESNKGEKK